MRVKLLSEEHSRMMHEGSIMELSIKGLTLKFPEVINM